MKIDMWPLDNDIIVKNINYAKNTTNFYINLKFRTEDKTHYIVQQFIGLYDWDEDFKNEIYPITYSEVSFSVDAIDLNPEEITNTLVSFLANYKLYLHHYNITRQETYVSYVSPETASNKPINLTYEPAYRSNSIYIDTEVQLEDDVDYFDLLNIKMKEPAKSISGKKIKELGYKINDYGIYNFAILDDENAKEYLI